MGIKYAALILAAINVVAFVVQASVSGFTDAFVLVSSDAAARPWILLTSMFLHSGTYHLLGNIFALGLFGLMLENIIGSRKFLAVYFVSGRVASSASVFFYDASLGASGAIFGVLGMHTALRPQLVVYTYGAPMPMIAAAGFWLLLDLLGVFYPTNVANVAHIAGLFFGALVGIFMRKNYAQPVTGRRRGKTISDEELEEWEDEWM
jgi:hypothetical protein